MSEPAGTASFDERVPRSFKLAPHPWSRGLFVAGVIVGVVWLGFVLADLGSLSILFVSAMTLCVWAIIVLNLRRYRRPGVMVAYGLAVTVILWALWWVGFP
jgi:hypothetical protein